MRILSRMLRWLSVGICALIIACLAATPALADTGTYRITDYTVKLAKQRHGEDHRFAGLEGHRR